MFGFLKPYTLYIAGVVAAIVLGAFGWLWADNALTHAALRNAQGDLKVAEQTIKAQERAIEAVDRVEEYRSNMNRILRTLNSRIMEAEGANQEVPPAAAHEWAVGIDSLRNDGGSDPRSSEDMPTP